MNTRMIITALAVLTVAVSGMIYQDASAATFTSEEQAWLANNTRIDVGSSVWTPYEYVDEDGGLAGVTADIADRFSEITGSTFVAHGTAAGNWAETLAGLRDGTVDVAFMIEDTGAPNRAGIGFTDPWLHVDTHVIVRDDDRTTTADNLAGKSVVTVRDYAVNNWLESKGIQFTAVGSTAEALRLVANGTHDAHVENWNVAYSIAADGGISGLANNGPSGYTYAVSIGYPEANALLGSILEKALGDIGENEVQVIVNSVVLRSNAGLITQSFTAEERSWLVQNPRISVGSADWPPYEYVDNAGNLKGVTAAIADRFSEITGSTFVAHGTAAGNWAETLAGLRDGTVDVAFMIEDTGAPNRAGIGFTDPWLHVDTHVIVRDDDRTTTADNLAGKSVVTVRDYAVNNWLESKGIQFTAVGSTAEALRLVANGTHDAHVENWNVAYSIAADGGISGLANNGPSGYEYSLSVGYDADNTVLGGILQKILYGIQGERDGLVADAISRSIAELGSSARACR
ncbi:MAG: transporter substrate-binding domain-containing protein [Thaumarchaeota archaeon]|nr:transporter substrate-binding domain-containing protein [Nitrososphaerota archaeon]